MENTREMNRKEFLEFIPKHVIQNVRLLLQGRLTLSNDSAEETSEKNSVDVKAAKLIQLDEERCLAWGGASCQSCYLTCPLRDYAITLDDQRPIVNMSFCDGCGQCVTACQTVNDRSALRMIANKL